MELRELANTDALTGLANRRYFMARALMRAAVALCQAKKQDRNPVVTNG